MIKLIAGLGNPGTEYAATRHNAGFWFIDQLARKAGTVLRHEKSFHGCAARAQLDGSNVWLLQPETFMNRSGLSIAALAHFYKISPDQILIVHDELDLPPGAVKLKLGGGSGGHNGLKDITAQLATPHYWRLRIGIGHPRTFILADTAAQTKPDVVNYVLKPPRKDQQAAIDAAIERSFAVLPLVIQGETKRAMMQLHRIA